MIVLRGLVYCFDEDRYQGQIFSPAHMSSLNRGFDQTYAEQLLTDNPHSILDFGEKIFYHFRSPFPELEEQAHLPDLLSPFGEAPKIKYPYTKGS